MTKASKEEPLISVIIPIYKVEEYLSKCIDSVINQTYKNLEIILVDDGSPDNCPKMCDEWAKNDNRIKVIHKKNGGLSDARNAGIDIAKGEYLTFIDSDDYIDNEYISTLCYLIKKYNSDISMVDIKRVFDNGKIYNTSNNEEFVMTQEEFFEKMLYGERDLDNSASAKLYKKELFNDVKYPVGRLYEDTATTYKIIFKSNQIPVLSKSLYNYAIRSTSIVQGNFSQKKLEIIDSTKEMTDAIIKKYPDLKKACKRKVVWSYLSTLSQLSFSQTRYKELEKELRKKVLENKKEVLKDKKVSKKDKIGIICITIGFPFYKFCWRVFSKINYGK